MCSKRTTNGSEIFHRKLNCLFYASHPSVFELVDRLQEIVFENSFKIRDGPSRPAKLCDRKKHDWMKSSIAEYVDGSLRTHAFLRRICNAPLPLTNLHYLSDSLTQNVNNVHTFLTVGKIKSNILRRPHYETVPSLKRRGGCSIFINTEYRIP